MLVAEGPTAVTLVCEAQSLLGHEVCHHVGCGSERCCDITLLNVLAAEMDAHVDVTSSRFVGRM